MTVHSIYTLTGGCPGASELELDSQKLAQFSKAAAFSVASAVYSPQLVLLHLQLSREKKAAQGKAQRSSSKPHEMPHVQIVEPDDGPSHEPGLRNLQVVDDESFRSARSFSLSLEDRLHEVEAEVVELKEKLGDVTAELAR